jgi:hypothetical protein
VRRFLLGLRKTIICQDRLGTVGSNKKRSPQAKKLTWPTSKAISYWNTDVEGAQTERVVLEDGEAADQLLTVTIRAMEVKTYLVTFE